MPGSRLLSPEEFARQRPYLFHLTASQNIERIRVTRRLDCTREILLAAGRPELTTERRSAHVTVLVSGQELVIRDQAPLYAGKMSLEPGLTFDEFVALLNSQVFFWPGKSEAPISYGLRHFDRYRNEPVAILRVPFADLVALNPGRLPCVCKYNSGSPRFSRGVASPRSRTTFVPMRDSVLRPGQVVEVTFTPYVELPASTTVARSLDEKWSKL